MQSNNTSTTEASHFAIKANELMARGLALSSASDTFNQEGFNLLARSAKLNPFKIDVWIQLAESYQKNSDVEGAIACLENGLAYCNNENNNKVILRKLSTCLRQKNCDTKESKLSALVRSLELSKLALMSDLDDKDNYYNLAKAYMCLFFATECSDQQLINLSKAAYAKALALSDREAEVDEKKDSGTGSCTTSDKSTEAFMNQSDFLFNYSTVLVYVQDFSKALKYVRRAIDLDPDWLESKTLEESLVDYLKQISSMLTELGKNKKKMMRRYGKIQESFKDIKKIELLILNDQQRLKRSPDLQVRSKSLDELETYDQSECLRNDKKLRDDSSSNIVELVHLKLVETVNYNQAMYLTFVGMDQNFCITVITIYNLAASRCPSTKDLLSIVNPKIESVKVKNLHRVHDMSGDDEDAISFNRINVQEFKDFYVNGHRISADQVSKPQFTVSVIP